LHVHRLFMKRGRLNAVKQCISLVLVVCQLIIGRKRQGRTHSWRVFTLHQRTDLLDRELLLLFILIHPAKFELTNGALDRQLVSWIHASKIVQGRYDAVARCLRHSSLTQDFAVLGHCQSDNQFVLTLLVGQLAPKRLKECPPVYGLPVQRIRQLVLQLATLRFNPPLEN